MREKACSVCFTNCVKLHGPDEEPDDAIPAHSPSFLKKIATSAKTSTMQIPSSFVKAHGERLGSSITLEGPSREKWTVEVGGSAQNSTISLRLGWTKFVTDHFLQIGDQLLFTLTTDSYFQVEVYDESGCQKLSALDAINTSTPLESNPTTVESNPTTLESNPAYVEPKAKKAKSGGPDRLKSSPALRLVGRKKTERHQPDKATPSAKKLLIDLESSDSDSGNVGAPGDDFEVVKPAKSKNPQDQISGDPDRQEGDLLPQQKLSNGAVISQRRSVTEAEKLHALQAAQALHLDNPNTLIVMTKAYVYKGFMLAFPKQFTRDSMPSACREVTLVNKAGNRWPVKWLHKDDGSQTGFSGGWRRFALDHRLEESDVCVFEIVDEKNFVMLVHIFRVLGGQSEDVAGYSPSPAKTRASKRRKVKKSQEFFQDVDEEDFSLFHKPRASVQTAAKTNPRSNRDSQGDKKPSTSALKAEEVGPSVPGSAQNEELGEEGTYIEEGTSLEARPKGISMFDKVGHGFLRNQFVIDGSLEYHHGHNATPKEKKPSQLASFGAENEMNDILLVAKSVTEEN